MICKPLYSVNFIFVKKIPKVIVTESLLIVHASVLLALDIAVTDEENHCQRIHNNNKKGKDTLSAIVKKKSIQRETSGMELK